MSRDSIASIPECEFCRVPVEKRGAGFNQRHPKCATCGVLMGPGHAEEDADAEYCTTCSRTRQREMALR